MKTWLDRLFLLALIIVVAVLTVTAAPTLLGRHLGGWMLLIHMMASGALVVGLPLFSIYWVFRCTNPIATSYLQRLGFWSLLLTGLITIATVFVCMLPIASTDQMHELMQIHGYAGFAMVPALLVLLIGVARWRRIQAMRSATPG